MGRRDAREGRPSTGGRSSSLNTREWMDGIDSLQTSAVLYSNTYYLVCKTKIINTVFRIKKFRGSRSRATARSLSHLCGLE